MSSTNKDLIHFEGYSVDRQRWQLRWRGEPIALSRKTFDLLLYLIDRHDAVVTKEDLLRDLWPKQVVEESNLTQQVFVLRKALSRHGSGKIIETVAGRGYRFTATIESATESAQRVETILSEVAPAPVAPSRHRSWTHPVVAAAAAVLGMLAALGSYTWYSWFNRAMGEPVDVVLADFGGTGDAALDRALNDALRIDLGQSPFLTVVPPNRVRSTLSNMKVADNTPLDAALAREVCERNSARVLLQGSVSRFGQRYRVALRASNCATETNPTTDRPDGDVLAQSQVVVDRLDDLPGALDTLAGRIRKGLGESRASIRRFDKPLMAVSTGSLAALKAYSEGYRRAIQGDWLASLHLFQHATELDPEFAVAYFDVAAVYGNLKDVQNERIALTKAYDLRDSVSEDYQFRIIALFDDVVAGDPAKSIETYKTWTALFPRSAAAFGNLAEEYDTIGQAPLGLEPAKRAVELRPWDSYAYQNLAVAQLHSGQPKASQKTCRLALEKGFDGADMRHWLLQSTLAQNDAAEVAEQLAWGHDHPEALQLRVDEILIGLSHGEVHNALARLGELNRTTIKPELTSQYHADLSVIARALSEMGMSAESAALLKATDPPSLDKNALVTLAEIGDLGSARQGLESQMQEHGYEMLWAKEKSPEIEAALLLAEHKPEQAVAALEPARAFEGLTFGPAFLRGQAYLNMGRLDFALGEFRKITEHNYIDPLSAEYPLATLASARAYAGESQPARAREQFERFFALWKSADADLPLLRAARGEYDHMIARLPLQSTPTAGMTVGSNCSNSHLRRNSR